MFEEWERVELGELIDKRSDFTPVDSDTEYVILGVKRSGWGFVEREPLFGRDQKFTKLMRLEENDLVYRTITAFEAPSAVAGPAEAGLFVTPQTFPVFRLNTQRLLPEYMRLLTTWTAFHDAMAVRCTGTVLRRKTLAVKAFRTIPIDLPPLPVQRRIAHVFEQLDESLRTAWGLKDAAKNLLRQLRQPTADTGQGDLLGELATMRSGPSWKSADESPVPTPEHEPVLAITNTPQGGELDLSTQRYVSGIPKSAQRLSENSLVMIRTNGNRSRIGNIYRASPEVEGFAVSAFQIAIEPHNPDDSAFLYWYLGAPDVQTSISENASGSTGLGNVAIGWLKQLRIPQLDAVSKAEYIKCCEAVSAVVTSASRKAERLIELRSNLLAALLSGEHEIPESYDTILEEALP